MSSASAFSGSLSSLQRSLSKLERMLAKIGTQLDTSDFRDSLSEESTISTHLVRDCVSALQGASRSDAEWMNKAFDSEYNRFQRIIKDIDIKQSAVLAKAARAAHNDTLASSLSREENEAKRSGVSLQDIQFVEYDTQEVERRHKQIKQLERDVLEIAQMYRDLNTLVNQQQVGLDIIESNVESTKHSVGTAETQIRQAADYQTAARKRKCICILIILAIIALVIGLAVGISKA